MAERLSEGFSGASVGKEPACNAGDTEDVGSTPGLGRSPGEGKGYPLQCSGLEISDCTVNGVTKSWTPLSDFHFRFTHKVSLQGNLGTTIPFDRAEQGKVGNEFE